MCCLPMDEPFRDHLKEAANRGCDMSQKKHFNLSQILVFMSVFFGAFKLQSVKFKLHFVGGCWCCYCQCPKVFYSFTHCSHFNWGVTWKTSSVKH
jgi:hypothetical protein